MSIRKKFALVGIFAFAAAIGCGTLIAKLPVAGFVLLAMLIVTAAAAYTAFISLGFAIMPPKSKHPYADNFADALLYALFFGWW